jgi:hypothetical protein
VTRSSPIARTSSATSAGGRAYIYQPARRQAT